MSGITCGLYSRAMAPDHPGGLTREHVVWAYRLLLDRDPENDDVIGPKLAGSRDTSELRRHLMTSAEFRDKNPDFAHTNDSTVVIKEIAPGVRLFLDVSDHVIGLNVLRGQYERDEIAFVRRVLKPGDVALDIGAHIGFFTMHMADAVGSSGRVYAFEPFDANADLLERSIAENRFGDRVVFRRAAVGAAAGAATLTFPIETLNSGGAYLLRTGTVPLAGNLTLEVTDRGRAVAILAPLPKHTSILDRLEAEGRLIRATGDLLALKRPKIRPPRPTSEMLDEERADRL